jgi:uncharacterized membrane protein
MQNTTNTDEGRRARLIAPTTLTQGAALAAVLATGATAMFLLLQYSSLPDLLPVHFNRYGAANGWQYRTLPRVMLPVAVQTLLIAILGSVAALLLSRSHGEQDQAAPDVRAAAVAAEAVVLLALVWVIFQGYAAVSLARLWTSHRPAALPFYSEAEIIGGLISAVVAARAHRRLGRPEPRPFVPAHWRFGQLYRNPDDPALFVPARDGRRWTLNFGRPVAGALLGVILTAGVVAPTLLIAAAFR